MIGRERELEKLTAFFSAAAEGEGACSSSQERRASERLGWPRRQLPRATSRVCGGSPPNEGRRRMRQSRRCFVTTSAGSRMGSRAQSRSARISAPCCLSSGRRRASPTARPWSRPCDSAFKTIAARQATVVFLDDLHWADAATLELLPSLAEASEELPLLVLGAYRSEEIPRGHPLRRLRTDLRRAGRLVELVVEPLDAAATAGLAAQRPRWGARPDAPRCPVRPHSGGAVLRGGTGRRVESGRPTRARPGWPRARGRVERPDPGDPPRRAPHPRRRPLG